MLLSLLWFPTEKIDEGELVLVEMFTSQGCSSCPSADRLLSDWQSAGKKQVVLLAFHVDYWNRLGWRDPFSRSEFSERQRAYGEVLPSRVYTPQMVVNGRHVLVGSNRIAAERAIQAAITEKAQIQVAARSEQVGDTIKVTYALKGELPRGSMVHAALVSDQLRTRVRRGENAGRDLINTAVVRRWTSGPAKKEGQLKLFLQPLRKDDFHRLVVWVQKGQVGPVTGVTQLEVRMAGGLEKTKQSH